MHFQKCVVAGFVFGCKQSSNCFSALSGTSVQSEWVKRCSSLSLCQIWGGCWEGRCPPYLYKRSKTKKERLCKVLFGLGFCFRTVAAAGMYSVRNYTRGMLLGTWVVWLKLCWPIVCKNQKTSKKAELTRCHQWPHKKDFGTCPHG